MPEPDRSFVRDLKNLDRRLGIKQCTKCGEEKQLSEFYVRTDRNNHAMSKCKECSKKASMAWASKNKEKAYANNKKCRTKYPERAKDSCKKWHENNRERARFLARRTAMKRRHTEKGKLKDNVACLIYQSLKRGSKAGRHWEDLVGYTLDQLKLHLEKRFKPGMGWENYGTVWSIDHKIPVSVFNFERPEDIDFRICWSLKNLQPLECSENSRKNNKIDAPFQPSLAMGGAL